MDGAGPRMASTNGGSNSKPGRVSPKRAFISTIAFHDLRHDFAHRARAADWSLEEVAYYLGHITKSGMPAIQTTIRYTQVSRKPREREAEAAPGVASASRVARDACLSSRFESCRGGLTYEKNDHQIGE